MQQINTIVGGQEVLIVLPDDFSAARTYYLIVWSHGMGDDAQGMLGYSDVINAMLPLGYLFAGTSAHGDNWGNEAALIDYANLIAYMRANYSITFVGFWGGSMGGLTGLLSIARGEIAGVKGAFLGLPVCNLGSMYNDLDWADSSINTAYNIPGGGNYATQTAGHDPILRPVSEYAGKRFRFTASPEDTLVLKSTNADAFSAYVSGVALEYAVLTIHGEHGVEHGMTPAEVVPFFERCCRVVDTLTLSSSVIAHAPVLIRESAFAIPELALSVSLYPPSVNEGVFIPATLGVAVDAPLPVVHNLAPPLARHSRHMGIATGTGAPAASFRSVLGSSIYPTMLERERRVLFGDAATCTLYSLTPGAGETVLIELRDYWSARRMPTIESGAIEQWRLEIANSNVSWAMLRNVSTVLIEPDTGEVQRYRVMQTENAMKPGHVYHLRIEAIAQQ